MSTMMIAIPTIESAVNQLINIYVRITAGKRLESLYLLARVTYCALKRLRPMLSSTSSFERWLKRGGKDTAVRPGEIWRAKLAAYEPPPPDDAIRAELDDFVVRRRRELGD
jgi:trimethylamine:corrinoid methyltransferase-like protein